MDESLHDWTERAVRPWADRAPFGVSVVDRGMRFVYINDALADINGLPVAAHLGERPHDLMPGLRDVAGPMLERAMAGEVVSELIAGQTRRRPRSAGTWASHQLPVEIEDERAVISVVFEITAEQAERAAMRRTNAWLRSQNEILTTLAHGIAHDLRSPVASALMQIQLARRALQRGALDEVSSMLTDAEQTLRHGSEMVGGLVRLAHTMRIPAADAVDPVPLVDQSWKAVCAALPGCESVTMETDRPLPVVLGDEALLRDVFQNLFENAVKYGRQGVPVRVRVRGEERGGRVVLRVSDNGRGVPEEVLGMATRSFVRGQDSTGLGIGLAMVDHIVRVHAGELRIEPNEPEGSVFIVELLAARECSVGSAIEAPPPTGTNDRERSGTRDG